MIKDTITLRPATLKDRENVFQWLTNSNLTQEMMGPPKYPDNTIPTWTEFINDYFDYYFDGSKPLMGRCFIIECNGQDIGQINYNKININEKSTDLDIWLSDKIYTGKGYGSEAIKVMCDYLKLKYGCKKIILSPSKRNINAIRSYEKAGFVMTNIKPKIEEMDYEDNVILIKMI